MEELIMEERIVKLEQKVITLEDTMKNLAKAYEEQTKTNQIILEKLNELIFVEKQSKTTYEHHTLLCAEVFDKRYVIKDNLRGEIFSALQSNRSTDVELNETKVSTIKNLVDIIWKVGIFIGVGYVVVQSFVPHIVK